ncbi:uncharacterized protein ASPGLDRAFT_39817 [Aspergillus glaucus CBS 516.65]|uniref:Uncharacterized protein n=1 Tax=Aspergillus glaucus CBS 516.65 TaxID=1160497 RepID=A0A1L9V6E3_ASPGL|nr:hypothetical protein ASPGLDRAFT_39817 [Aspergillus glaucus CBS 516.65]OJJ79497.1 hypothetical protein ASPGLDRAFT_39817 [Aspergillus glaucus CBS 516.65]
MNFFILLFLVFFSPLLLVLAWFAFFRLRRHFEDESTRPAFGRSYLRTMAQTGGAMSEQIELQDMLEDSNHEE